LRNGEQLVACLSRIAAEQALHLPINYQALLALGLPPDVSVLGTNTTAHQQPGFPEFIARIAGGIPPMSEIVTRV